MYQITSADALAWIDAERTAISGLVQFDAFPEPLPYTFVEAEWGEEWARIVAGNYGPVADYVEPPPPAPVVPEVVTMRQAKLTLAYSDILDQADAIIAAMQGLDGKLAQIEWSTATTIRRDHPLVAALGQQIGLADEQIDALFTWAATL